MSAVPERPAARGPCPRPRRGGSSSRRTSVTSDAATSPSTSADTSAVVNEVPHTAAAWTTARSASSSRSRRAASSIWIESGSVSSSPSSAAASSCSMKSGLPSAISRMRLRAAASSRSVRGEPVEESLRLRRRQRIEEDRRAAHAPAAPVRPEVEQVGTREAEHQDGSVGELDERLDEVEERGCGPVHVLENEQQRALPREAGQQPARGERGVLGVRGSRLEPDGDGELIGQLRGRRRSPAGRRSHAAGSPSASSVSRPRSGSYVASRPSARQRATAAFATPCSRSTHSTARRDLPTPGRRRR